MRKRTKRMLAAVLSLALLPVIPITGANASYTTDNDVYNWDLTDITEEIGYNEAEFQAGKAYEYHGLTITGNNAVAKIDAAGVKIGKVTSNNGQMNIAYTPPCPGKLTVTAAITKSGSYLSKIYVNTALGKTGDAGNPIITDKTAAGTYTGETDLEAGNTYYIYDGSTATAHIESITFAPDLSQATASMSLNNTFSDNMLIQRDKPIILKGNCAFLNSADITLKNDNDESDVQTATVDLSGSFSWRTELNAVSNYTDTYTLTITPSNSSIEPIEIKNIIFGDLYLCAGQSNMVVPASFYKGLGIDYTSEQLAAKHDDIRYFNISTNNTHTSSPQESVLDSASWKVLQSGGIPATAYSFAEKLNSETDVPIGVIVSAMKGTYISQWLPNTKLDQKNISSNYYNTKIYPFRDMQFSGILWYQGESDRSATDTYKERLKSLIEEYRTLFANEAEVPFYYVQIARYGGGIDPADPTNVNEYDPLMAEVRAIQSEVYSELKDTKENFGIIPTLDLYGNKENDTTYVSSDWGMSRGNARSSIHPGQKTVIAERAVNWVLKDVYGKTKHKDETAIYTTGPVYKSKSADGSTLTVEFESTGELKLMETEQYSDNDSAAARTEYNIDPSKPQEFEIAGEDGVYYRANAELDGSRVILTSENVSAPVNFRYAYTGRAGGVYVECPNLTDDTNLPALVTSTARGTTAASENEYTKSFTKNTEGGLTGRVKTPSDYSEKSYPLVVFLHGVEQKGTDNLSQLAAARTLFEAVGGGAILAAPQTADSWDADKVKAYIDAVKAKYNASYVAVCGYSMGAPVCYELAKNNTAQKIIPIAGNAVLSENDITAIKSNNVSAWVISSYEDDEAAVAGIRTTVNAMQKAKADVIYTEYPLLAHDICEKALSQDGLADWILDNAEEKKTVDLVLFAGQSNMAGRGDYESATICPPLQGYEFHAVTDALAGGGVSPVLSAVNEPFGKYENNSVMNDSKGTTVDRRTGDMVSSVMKSYYDKTGVPIVGVQASRGGEDTAYFKSDAIMTEIIKRYTDAEKYLEDAGYEVRKKFLVWCQGCSDADKIISDSAYTLDDYKANTLDIFDRIKTGTGIEDVFMVRIGHRNNNNTEDAVYKTVNEAQAQIIEGNEHIYEAGNLYTDAYKSKMRDAYHYYQSAYNSIGLAAGENIAAVYASGTDDPTEPEPENDLLPAGKVLQKADTAAMTAFAPSSQVAAGTYYLAGDASYDGTIKYLKNGTSIYGQGNIFTHSASGHLLGSDTNSDVTFCDLVFDGANKTSSSVPFNTDSKAGKWTFANCIVRNYNAGDNALMSIGGANKSTVDLSNFKIDSTAEAAHSIDISAASKGTLNLGANITIPDIHVSEGANTAITFAADFSGAVGISADAFFRNRDESNLQNPIATVTNGADMSKVTCLDENCTVKAVNGKLYIMTAEAEQEKDAVLYAVYTLDGTADGEITRTRLLTSYSGETVSVPNTALAARKFTDADSLYDVYECVSADKKQITLEKGDNIVYITVKHADGKYYYWEDFEGYEPGSIEKDNKWYHGGTGTVSDFINCTTDAADTTLAARWYSSNTNTTRSKNFSIFSGTPEIPKGEKLVFSADLRMSATRNADYRTSLSVGNGTDTMMLMSVANSVTASLNDGTTMILPEVSGTKEETGGDGTAFSKWINVNITIDPSLTKNNTTVTLTPLNNDDTFTVTRQIIPGSGFEYRDGAVTVYEDGTLIIADYDGNGVLKDIETKEVSSGDNIPAASVNNRKIMLWNSLDKMEPLCDAVTLPLEEKPVETKTETVSSYSYKMTSDVNAVTHMSVNLCKGYRGAVVADNIKLYNTQSEYLTPAKNELAQAIAIYGDIHKSLYTDNGIGAYDSAVSEAKSVLADSTSTNKNAKDAKTALINAASSLALKSVQDGDRTVINENADWIFIKEKNYQSEISEITDSAPDELSLSGWTGVSVPHTWNAYDGSDGGGDYDTCKSWYRKSMYIDSTYDGKKVYLEFDGSSIRTELYINGVHVPFSYDDPFGTANSDGIEYEHKGGFNTFRFDITDYVNYGDSNTVAVSVDNRIKADTLPLSGDYSREGGIYRDVSLIVTNPVHVDMLDDGSCGLYLTPKKTTSVEDDTNKDFTLTAAAKIVNDSDEDRTIKIEALLCEPDHYDVPDNEYIKAHLRFNPNDMYTEGGKTVGTFETKTVTIRSGESYDYTDTIDVIDPKLWDGPESPYRYEVKLKVTADGTEAESLSETVGFRYFRAPDPEGINKGGSFYLNGRQYPIEGVGKHQDWGKEDGALGIATTEKEMLSDAGTIYELGANGVRLVHYQHSLDEIELYDKLGITVWSEPALCSAMTNADAEAYPAFEKATLYQLSAMIKQQYNKPCVLFWGFSNEITHEWDDNLKQIAAQEKKFTSAPALFLKMQNLAKSLDPVRLTTYAANTRRHEGDLYTDITGSNIYPYWYVNRTATQVSRNDYEALQKWITDGTTKPISVSEYGGAAIVGNTYEYNADGSVDFLGTSAESNTTYQAYLHEKAYREFRANAGAYWGKYVWQMFDSASDGKTDGSMLGINTKGLVSYDHVTRKDAYYFYKANWNNFEPFAFVVNTSRTQRPDPTTIIRAYTNMDLCRLYVNGEKYGEPITDTNANDAVADGVHVFMWYDVPLTGGDDKIEVRGIKDGKEICSSLDTNGEITFKTMFDGTSIKSNDTSKLIINSSDAVMQCKAKDAPAVSEVRDIVTILSTSNMSVIMPDGTAANGKLAEGMKIRITAADGTYKDYAVKAEDITNDAVITASEGDASILIDGNTSASWKGGAGSSVKIDLGEEYNLNALDIYSTGEAAYTAAVSSDGTAYKAAAVTDGKFAADTSGRYVELTFTNAAQVSEINIYGWRFDNIGNYRIDGKNIYLSSAAEHDTDELMTNLLLIGQAAYDFVLEEATRVLSDGAILRVTEKYGDTVDYTIKISD